MFDLATIAALEEEQDRVKLSFVGSFDRSLDQSRQLDQKVFIIVGSVGAVV
jgi:hypothetical protein